MAVGGMGFRDGAGMEALISASSERDGGNRKRHCVCGGYDLTARAN